MGLIRSVEIRLWFPRDFKKAKTGERRGKVALVMNDEKKERRAARRIKRRKRGKKIPGSREKGMTLTSRQAFNTR